MGILLMEEILNHLLVTIGNYWELWNTVKNGIIAGYTIYQMVQDFFHPQYHGD